MATTIPIEFTGEPTLTPKKVENIKEWYKTILGDSDKATDADDHEYYTGAHEALSQVLLLLHDMPLDYDNHTQEIKNA